MNESNLSALLEAIVYLAEEPVRLDQIAGAFPDVSSTELKAAMDRLMERYQAAEHGIEMRQIAGGYRFSTKPEHHEVLKRFTKSLVPATRLSLAALETLAVIAYRQPVTIPEIQEIRGVQASGVIKTLVDRKLVTAAGRKDVIGRPILYKTTRNFLIHFGLNDLGDLPSVEEFEELIRSEHARETAELPFDQDNDHAGPNAVSDADDASSEEAGAGEPAAPPAAELEEREAPDPEAAAPKKAASPS
jgi:segregation and condensation protein B